MHSMVYKPSMGVEGGGPTMWWGSVLPDQQPMDEHSLVYDSEKLDTPLEILGRPIARLRVSADAPRANWVVRVSDIAPDGKVTQVAGAGFNGTHRKSAREPEDIIPGEEFDLNIELHFTSWVFPKGHKIRVSISNAQWPMFWPTPFNMESMLTIGGEAGARIDLPIVQSEKKYKPNFKKPSPSPVLPNYRVLDSGNITGYAALNEIKYDKNTGEAYGVATNSGSTQYPWGIERFEEEIEHRTSDDNPAYTSVTGRYKITEELDGRTLDFEQNVEFKSDEENFYLTFHRWVSINGELYKERIWQEAIPRDFQ